MKAWICTEAGAELHVADVEEAILEPTGLVVEVEYCGLCHSDLHRWHGTTDLGRRGIVKRPNSANPFAMGHEIVGRIVKTGPEVSGRALGEAVVVYPWFGCGTCKSCLAGQDNMCTSGSRSLGFSNHGGFARRVTVPHERYAVPLGDLAPAQAAPLACAGLTVRSAIRKIEPLEPEETVILIGAGGVGLTAIAVLYALGHRRIVSIDLDPAKEDAAKAAGAASFVCLSEGMEPSELIEALGGKVKSVIDFVNSASSASLAFELLAKGGKMVQVGLYGGELVIPLPLLTGAGLTIQGSLTRTLEDLHDVVALARQGMLPQIPVKILPRADVNDALVRLDRGNVTGRMILKAGGPGELDWTGP